MNKILSSLKPTTGKALGPLEQRLLEELWSRGSATVRELVDDGDHKLAYTTVMTTLDRLFKKRVLNRVAEGESISLLAVTDFRNSFPRAAREKRSYNCSILARPPRCHFLT